MVQVQKAQEYINKQEKTKKELRVNSQNLKGDVIVENFSHLERLYCEDNKLTGLELRNLPKLTEINACKNQLAKMIIENCPNIKELNVSITLQKNLCRFLAKL